MMLKTSLLLILVSYSQERATITENGYEDIVVSIAPDVSNIDT